MATTRRKQKSTGAASSTKAEKIIVPSHWGTTDEDEVNRRRSRAASEAMQVVAREPRVAYFGDYSVRSGSGSAYHIEIRSLDARLNSCTCADYDTNGLGTCKHIEKVLLELKKKTVRKFEAAAETGSPRAEIYVHPADETVRINWPNAKNQSLTVRRLLDAFFSADGGLIAAPEVAIPTIHRAVQEAPKEVTAQIRLSHRLERVQARGHSLAQRTEAREHFLQDVRNGKRSMDVMKLPLYEYQQQGMLHLAFAERAILADEMGLGKTVQAVAACELLRRLQGVKRVLVVATTSLKSEWAEQIDKFSDLGSVMVAGSRPERLRQYSQGAFFTLTNYEQVLRDKDDIQRLVAPDVIILDEAQRIKNWRTKTAATIKTLQSRYAFVLTGAPIENRIDDLYSIVQFLDLKFFGPLFRFNREYYQLDEKGKPVGYKNLDALHRRVHPILLRRRKSDVEGELPDRIVNHYFVAMTEEQKLRYADYEAIVAKLAAVARRRALLPKEFEKLQLSLASMRMLCDTPYILDENCRLCPKLDELQSLLDELLEDDTTKIIIFSEWERMLMLVREALEERGIGFAWHTGSVNQKKRPLEIGRFKNDPACRVFLSTDAGSVGLNLQVANVVINMDLPWNPAKLEQRIARAWRKHQTRSVRVINLVSENTIEHRMLGLLKQKQALADNVLESGGEASMDLPSGRAALMERLNEVLDQPPAAQAQEVATEQAPSIQEKSIMPLERFREETLARFAPRLERLDAYGSTVLAVVEGAAKEPAATIQALLTDADPRQTLVLEVLDKTTYATIQRLIEAGVLAWGSTQATSLHRATPVRDAEREARQQRLREARAMLEQAERKRRMAELLIANGFTAESLAPMREAHDAAMKAITAFATQAEPVPAAITSLANTINAALQAADEQTHEESSNNLTLREQYPTKALYPITALLEQIETHLNCAAMENAA